MKRNARTGRPIEVDKYRDADWRVEPSRYEKAMAEIQRRRAAGLPGTMAIIGQEIVIT